MLPYRTPCGDGRVLSWGQKVLQLPRRSQKRLYADDRGHAWDHRKLVWGSSPQGSCVGDHDLSSQSSGGLLRAIRGISARFKQDGVEHRLGPRRSAPARELLTAEAAPAEPGVPAAVVRIFFAGVAAVSFGLDALSGLRLGGMATN